MWGTYSTKKYEVHAKRRSKIVEPSLSGLNIFPLPKLIACPRNILIHGRVPVKASKPTSIFTMILV